MARGGYRKPSNPAPVSGPGRLSRRTDGGPAQNLAALPNAGYGEGQEFTQLQQGAPLAATPAPAPAGGGGGMDVMAILGGAPPVGPPTPLSSPTERPDEPLTAGAPFGDGPGPSPEIRAPMAGRLTATLERLLENDLTGEIADMYVMARRQGL